MREDGVQVVATMPCAFYNLPAWPLLSKVIITEADIEPMQPNNLLVQNWITPWSRELQLGFDFGIMGPLSICQENSAWYDSVSSAKQFRCMLYGFKTHVRNWRTVVIKSWKDDTQVTVEYLQNMSHSRIELGHEEVVCFEDLVRLTPSRKSNVIISMTETMKYSDMYQCYVYDEGFRTSGVVKRVIGNYVLLEDEYVLYSISHCCVVFRI